MIIDSHTHIFPDKIAKRTIDLLSEKGDITPFSDGTFDGLVNAIEEAGADIAVNLPVVTNPAQFDSVNRFAAAVNDRFKENGRGILSFAGIHPLCENIEEKMEEIKKGGFLGIKIHPDYQETFIDDIRYETILRSARDLDLIVVTHSGVDGGYRDCPIRCTPDRVLRLIEKVPYSKFVLAHLGANEMSDGVLELLCGEDVYLDTAYILRFIGKERFVEILNRHGADKILFASDSPWSHMGNDVNILRSFSLDQQTEDKILYQNAKKLLGL